MVKAFTLFRNPSNGRIGLDDLQRVAREIGEAMTDEELQVSQPRAGENRAGEKTPFSVNISPFLLLMVDLCFFGCCSSGNDSRGGQR